MRPKRLKMNTFTLLGVSNKEHLVSRVLPFLSCISQDPGRVTYLFIIIPGDTSIKICLSYMINAVIAFFKKTCEKVLAGNEFMNLPCVYVISDFKTLNYSCIIYISILYFYGDMGVIMEKTFCRYKTNENNFNFVHSVAQPPGDFPVHIHDLYELYYFISGDVTYYIEGQAYNIKRNDILIINNRELHRPVFNSTRPYERMVIHFKPEYVSLFQSKEYNLLYYFEKRRLGQYNRIESEDVLQFGINKYFNQIEKCATEESAERHVMIKTVFVQMLVALNKIFDQKKNVVTSSFGYDKKISAILDFINNHLDEKITLDTLEHKFFVNKYYLCHLFKKNTGFTVIEYITYKRIMKAKELLLAGIPATEACHSVGFSDYSNFYKVFKKIIGVSPRNFTK